MGVRGTSCLCCRFLYWINGNQIVQPAKSLEAKSCCWSPSVCRAAGLGLFGGKWDVGWDLGSQRLGNCHGGGSLPMHLGSCFLRAPHGAVLRGRALGTARWRYVARHTLLSLGNVSGRGGDGHVPIPNPVGCRAWPGAHPRSRVWGGKRVSRVLQHTVGCGMGQIQPHPGKEHGTGTGPAFPLHWGHSGTPALGLPLCPTPHPGSTQPPWWHRVKSCPNLFLAVLQLGINGLGRQLGNASCAGPSPFAALPVSKFPLQTSIF